MKRTNVIIDCHFLCWRSFYSMRDLEFAGVPTGVLFGFLKQLEEVISHRLPCRVILAWDSRKSVRRAQYPEYKISRDSDSEEEKEKKQAAAAQIKDLRKWVVRQMGIHQSYILTGFEADDIIAQWVFSHQDDNNIVVTGDEDLFQLLGACTIYNPGKRTTMTSVKFRKIYGVNPPQWVDVKAIGGCSSDNVPGLHRIGEKTALQYIRGDMGTHTATYKRIEENTEQIEFCRSLVCLPHAICPELPRCAPNTFNEDGFLSVCDEYGLSSLKKQCDTWRNLING